MGSAGVRSAGVQQVQGVRGAGDRGVRTEGFGVQEVRCAGCECVQGASVCGMCGMRGS